MLSEKIRELRRKNKLSQKELANKLNVSNGAIAMWETGKREPNSNTLYKLANIFSVSIDYLIGNELYNKPAGEFYQLTDKQKELIPYIKNLDDGACMRVLGYLDKISQEQEELNRKFN